MQINYSDHVPQFKNKDELSKFLTEFAFQRYHINRAAQLFGKGDAKVSFDVKEGKITVERGDGREVIDLTRTEGKKPTWTFARGFRSKESLDDSAKKINSLADVLWLSLENKVDTQPKVNEKPTIKHALIHEQHADIEKTGKDLLLTTQKSDRGHLDKLLATYGPTGLGRPMPVLKAMLDIPQQEREPVISKYISTFLTDPSSNSLTTLLAVLKKGPQEIHQIVAHTIDRHLMTRDKTLPYHHPEVYQFRNKYLVKETIPLDKALAEANFNKVRPFKEKPVDLQAQAHEDAKTFLKENLGRIGAEVEFISPPAKIPPEFKDVRVENDLNPAVFSWERTVGVQEDIARDGNRTGKSTVIYGVASQFNGCESPGRYTVEPQNTIATYMNDHTQGPQAQLAFGELQAKIINGGGNIGTNGLVNVLSGNAIGAVQHGYLTPVSGNVDQVIKDLREKGHLIEYTSVANKPEGGTQPVHQILVAAAAFGGYSLDNLNPDDQDEVEFLCALQGFRAQFQQAINLSNGEDPVILKAVAVGLSAFGNDPEVVGKAFYAAAKEFQVRLEKSNVQVRFQVYQGTGKARQMANTLNLNEYIERDHLDTIKSDLAALKGLNTEILGLKVSTGNSGIIRVEQGNSKLSLLKDSVHVNGIPLNKIQDSKIVDEAVAMLTRARIGALFKQNQTKIPIHTVGVLKVEDRYIAKTIKNNEEIIFIQNEEAWNHFPRGEAFSINMTTHMIQKEGRSVPLRREDLDFCEKYLSESAITKGELVKTEGRQQRGAAKTAPQHDKKWLDAFKDAPALNIPEARYRGEQELSIRNAYLNDLVGTRMSYQDGKVIIQYSGKKDFNFERFSKQASRLLGGKDILNHDKNSKMITLNGTHYAMLINMGGDIFTSRMVS